MTSKERKGCGAAMEWITPAALKVEHQDLHRELARAAKEGGKTGEAARKVINLLHPHLVKEEEFALPPLALLRALARGELKPEMERALPLSNRLKADLPEMLREHAAIMDGLRVLARAARQEKKPAAAKVAEKLEIHAQMEEEILYPAAILAGEYIKANMITVRR